MSLLCRIMPPSPPEILHSGQYFPSGAVIKDRKTVQANRPHDEKLNTIDAIMHNN